MTRAARHVLSRHRVVAEGEPEEPPPKEEPAEGGSGFLLGVGTSGGWGLPNEAVELAQICSYVRLCAETSTFQKEGPVPYTSRGLGWIYDTVAEHPKWNHPGGPAYRGSGSNGIQGINRATFAKECVETYEAFPSMIALEVLNEPWGPWFWGEAESAANAKAYAELVEAVKAAFETYAAAHGGKRPLILMSYSPFNGWGARVVAQKADAYTHCDGVVLHTYTKEGGKAVAKRGDQQPFLSEVFAKFKKGLWITEHGLPTGSESGDSLQYSEAEQALGLEEAVHDYKATVYVEGYFYYQFRGAEHEYGLVSAGGTKKQAFNKMKALSGK